MLLGHSLELQDGVLHIKTFPIEMLLCYRREMHLTTAPPTSTPPRTPYTGGQELPLPRVRLCQIPELCRQFARRQIKQEREGG